MTVGGTQGTTAVQEARRLDVPFLPLSKFAEEGAWSEHVKDYEAYASLRKDSTDCTWFHLTLEPSVREMLSEDYEVSFPDDTAKGDADIAETTVAYVKRRDDSFKAIASALLKELAVEGASASTDAISSKCRWNPPNRGKLKPYATVHKALFKAAVKELHTGQQTKPELVRLWLSCFAAVGTEKDLKRYGEGEKFTEWLQYANRLIEMSSAIDSCDHFRALLGVGSVGKKKPPHEPKTEAQRQKEKKKAKEKNLTPEQKAKKELINKLREKSKAGGHENKICNRCGRKGHIEPNCYTRLDPSAPAEKRSVQPTSAPTSPRSDPGRPSQPLFRNEKTFREGTRRSPRFAASAIKKMSNKTLRTLVGQAFGSRSSSSRPSGKPKHRHRGQSESEDDDSCPSLASSSSDESEDMRE